MDLVDEDPRASLIISGAPALDVDRALSISEGRAPVRHEDRFVDPDFDLIDLVGDRTGSAIVVTYENNRQLVTLIPLEEGRADESQATVWDLPSEAADVLGAWQDQLLLHQANRIWLLDVSFRSTLVAEGELLTYDGTHLARLRCDELDVCQLLVGTPDAPDTHVLDLPEILAPLSLEAWVGSIAIAPDGTRLGASVRYGALSLPLVLDLTTGETLSLPDGVNRQAPVAWSPDGEWLSLVYIDDVMVWNIAQNRAWLIEVNRDMERLIWH
jgi:WD40 repeat protein